MGSFHAPIVGLKDKSASKLGNPSRWNQIDSLDQKKGSAEAATSPSHGSNNSTKDTAVNEEESNTAREAAAIAGVGTTSSPQADLFLALVDAYSAGIAAFNTSCVSLSSEQLETVAAVTWMPAYDALTKPGLPPAMSAQSAIAGLRIVLDDDDGNLTKAIVPSVLAFLESGDAGNPDDHEPTAQLDRLIADHRRVDELLNVSMDADEALSPYSSQNVSDWSRRLQAEERQALEAILAWRPTTLSANAVRMRYLDRGPWEGCIPGEDHYLMLFNSLVQAGSDHA